MAERMMGQSDVAKSSDDSKSSSSVSMKSALGNLDSIAKTFQGVIKDAKKLSDIEEAAYKNKQARDKQITDLQKKYQDATAEADKKRYKERLEQIQKLAEKEESAYKQHLANIKKFNDNVSKMLGAGIEKTRAQLESYMKSLNSIRETISYGLSGTSTSLDSLVSNINAAIGSSAVVKQENLYRNLQSLINSGIVYNAEQRAYLTTLSEDLGMAFRADNASLARLVNLHREDMSSQRMAIEASLKTFLNQNYQTSQYIKQGFESVSNALFEAQALMSTSEAMNFEATIQKWMGSLSSVGMSTETITSLANAIGAASSGNVAGLSGGISNLLYMGAARSNIDIGEMLSGGLSDTSANALMSGIVNYIASMGSSESNVVKSALARTFGINVSDIVAASKVRDATTTGRLSTDIESSLLNSVYKHVGLSNMFDNMMANLLYGSAAGMVMPLGGNAYALYRLLTSAGDLAAEASEGITLEASPFGIGVSTDLGKNIQYLTNLGAVASSGLMGLATTVAGALAEGGFGYSASSAFRALGKGGTGSNAMDRAFSSAGGLSSFLSAGTPTKSGSAIYGTSNAEDIAQKVRSSAKKDLQKEVEADRAASGEKSINDLYDAMISIKDTIGSGSASVSSSVITTGSGINTKLESLSILSSIDGSVDAIYKLLKDWQTPQGVSNSPGYNGAGYNNNRNPGNS